MVSLSPQSCAPPAASQSLCHISKKSIIFYAPFKATKSVLCRYLTADGTRVSLFLSRWIRGLCDCLTLRTHRCCVFRRKELKKQKQKKHNTTTIKRKNHFSDCSGGHFRRYGTIINGRVEHEHRSSAFLLLTMKRLECKKEKNLECVLNHILLYYTLNIFVQSVFCRFLEIFWGCKPTLHP